MNEFERALADALRDSADEQYGEFYGEDIGHRFSRGYKRQKRRSIRLAEKTRRGAAIPPAEKICMPSMRGIPLKKRFVIISIAILMAVGVSAGAGASLAVGFRQTEETVIDFTLVVAEPQNSPQSIEEVYYLSEIPQEYYLDHVDYDMQFDVQYFYECEENDDFIYFDQMVRTMSMSYDNEHILSYEEVMVGDMYGVFMTWEDTTILLWDNMDYAFEIFSRLPKEEAIKLAKSAKLCENQKKFKK